MKSPLVNKSSHTSSKAKKFPNQIKNILCIGAGHVGGPTMAVFADKLPHVTIRVADINAQRIAQWNSSELPVFEPGMQEIIQRTRGRNLFFETLSSKSFHNAEMIFISVNTPTKSSGYGQGMASDLRYWEQSARSILKYTANGAVVVEKSTVPLNTAAAIDRILQADNHERPFVVLSNPEFMAEGTAIADLTDPDRTIIGGPQNELGQQAIELLANLYAHWIPQERILRTSVWSSELSKLTANAMLAQRISSINAISALCERSGALSNQVSRAVGMDHRLGPHFLEAGIGFGGSCFRKDILSLAYILEQQGLKQEANYWKQVVVINDNQVERFFHLILHALFDTIADKKLAILGVAFKPDTNDTRDSPALYLCRKLLQEHAHLNICDPCALENFQHTLLESNCDDSQLLFHTDPYQTTKDTHAIILLTHWSEFESLNYQRIYQQMQKPACFFDGRGKMPVEELYKIGFDVYSIGRPPLLHR